MGGEYRPGREKQDSRVDAIKKTSEMSENMPDPIMCKHCHGFGETAVLGEDGKITGKKICTQCDGTGAEL